MEHARKDRPIVYAAAIATIVSLVTLLPGCQLFNPHLECHYQPVRGSAVLNDYSKPATIHFTPDALPDHEWFERYSINRRKLDIQLHRGQTPLQRGTSYQAIVNIRTDGRCAPYVVYLLR